MGIWLTGNSDIWYTHLNIVKVYSDKMYPKTNHFMWNNTALWEYGGSHKEGTNIALWEYGGFSGSCNDYK